MNSREDHIAWCKQQALEYLDAGDITNAIASMIADLGKHPDIRYAPVLAAIGLVFAIQQDEAEARRWIEGFR